MRSYIPDLLRQQSRRGDLNPCFRRSSHPRIFDTAFRRVGTLQKQHSKIAPRISAYSPATKKSDARHCSPRCPRSEWRVLPHCDKTGTKRILIHNASSLPPVLRRAAKKSRQARLPFERSPRRSCRHNCRQASWQSSRLS